MVLQHVIVTDSLIQPGDMMRSKKKPKFYRRHFPWQKVMQIYLNLFHWVPLITRDRWFGPNKWQAITWACGDSSLRHIDGLVQDCRNSSALAVELLQSCTKPSICVTRPEWLKYFGAYVYEEKLF